jgi:hypothetical protein
MNHGNGVVDEKNKVNNQAGGKKKMMIKEE